MCIAFLEVPYTPCIWSEDSFLQNPAEFPLSAAFQLDEVLNLLIRAELRRLIKIIGWPCILFCKQSRRRERSFAIHPNVDRNKRKCRREVPERKYPGGG